ncbi:hypothetical protein L211DRAFT_479105 [Terfezia boudieri ATCC MYA-4762]|uniref:Uncharacterized protein n=1 Tax=Terfezia boudieri ATCC MYA-4762 TaxID=1051890 RepID=A0A3N4LYQ6_9PEZI|nr:hypothetical protein L211DRAFT_479105 [Terfezia boudieri ATCC MYA-4762]
MPLSPPLTPNRPTRGPGSNLVSTSDDHGTPYETGYSTQRTGGPGNVISSKSQEEQAKDRRGTFGEGQASNSGGKHSTPTEEKLVSIRKQSWRTWNARRRLQGLVEAVERRCSINGRRMRRRRDTFLREGVRTSVERKLKEVEGKGAKADDWI